MGAVDEDQNHRTVLDWDGAMVETLADLWPDPVRAMIVGLNPAPSSVIAGHYYQGAVGQRQMRRLAHAGLFEVPDDTRTFERAALVAGIGFTDIVKRPTPREGGVSRSEIVLGRVRLVEQLNVHQVPLVICVFRQPVKALLGTEGVPGLQHDRTPWGGELFRMPGPYARAEDAAATMAQLADWWERQ